MKHKGVHFLCEKLQQHQQQQQLMLDLFYLHARFQTQNGIKPKKYVCAFETVRANTDTFGLLYLHATKRK